MPRIPYSRFATARNFHPLLPLLLRPCRDLRSAQLEFKWLQEHAKKIMVRQVGGEGHVQGSQRHEYKELEKLVKLRSRGVPLQYLLGTEFFGDLELVCRPGVLIPRPATADMVMAFLERLRGKKLPEKLKMLDICSGSGCIPLLVAHAFPQDTGVAELEVVGLDISPLALNLAKENQRRVLEQPGLSDLARSSIENMRFIHGDLLKWDGAEMAGCDVIFSNPPYISPSDYWHKTAGSVRRHEPQIALVPPKTSPELRDEEQADLFYSHLTKLAQNSRSKLLLVEVGDMPQAKRVAAMFKDTGYWDGIEIWRDNPRPTEGCEAGNIRIIGSGEGRSVFCWTNEAKSWVFP
jgi:HemK-like putative methylase